MTTTSDFSQPAAAPAAVAVQLRYFAAAQAASGLDEERVTLASPATLAEVLADAAARHGTELARVLDRCSYLRNGVSVRDMDTEFTDGDTVDVLPPFAGG